MSGTSGLTAQEADGSGILSEDGFYTLIVNERIFGVIVTDLDITWRRTSFIFQDTSVAGILDKFASEGIFQVGAFTKLTLKILPVRGLVSDCPRDPRYPIRNKCEE